MSSLKNIHQLRSFQRGFTLVELLLVLFILSSLALLAAAAVDGADDQVRFDQTKSRLEQIRRAILGDSSRTLNGQPEVSGFVADMGRLPSNLRELIEPPADVDQLWGMRGLDLSGVALPLGALYGGWRGPYLQVDPSTTALRTFHDGWNNDLSGAENDFGWRVTEANANFAIQSVGADAAVGSGDNLYDVDYPANGNLINEDDWRLDLDGLSLRVRINGDVSGEYNNLQLYIYSLQNGQLQAPLNSEDFTAISGVEFQEVDAAFVGPDSNIPLGLHAAVVVCNDAGVLSVFDGACPGDNNFPPYQFTFLPRAQLPVIQWNIR